MGNWGMLDFSDFCGSLDAPYDIYDIDYELQAKYTPSIEEIAEKISDSWFNEGWYK